MFQNFDQLARFTSSSPRKGGFGRVRNLSLPKVDRTEYEFNTDKTNPTFSSELIVTTKGPETGDLYFLASLLKHNDGSDLNSDQQKGRKTVLAYLELYLQLGPIATFHTQTSFPHSKFSLIEFLVERTAGFTTARSIFGEDSRTIDLEALRSWGHEFGIEEDELSLLFHQRGPLQVSTQEAKMSSRFSDLQKASMKRQEELLMMNLHFSRSY